MPPRSVLAQLDAWALAQVRALAARHDVGRRLRRSTREVALTLAVVLLVGAGAAGAAREVPPTAAAAVAARVVEAPGAGTPVSFAELAFTLEPPRPRTVSLADRAFSPPAAPVPPPRLERWLPAGTGMWLHEWHRSQGGDAADVVARSKRSGFTHLYVQTGSTKKGWIGDEVLSELLPATAGHDIDVIAWDFPKLIDPEDDARRMARAATWSRPGAPRVRAVAPDVETAAEGTRLSAEAVTRYYAELRRQLPADVPILATVPWPSEKRTGSYPYAETAAWSDALIPMAYWYNRDPRTVTETSMRWLSRFGIPVMPVGQGYDGRLDAPYLPADPDPALSVRKFIAAAKERGARSISLWSWQTTGGVQWSALRDAGTVGPPRVAEPKPVAGERSPRDAAPGRQGKQGRPGGRGFGKP